MALHLELDESRLVKALEFKTWDKTRGFAWAEPLPENQISLQTISLRNSLVQIPVSLLVSFLIIHECPTLFKNKFF